MSVSGSESALSSAAWRLTARRFLLWPASPVEFACSPCVCVTSLQLLPLPPSVRPWRTFKKCTHQESEHRAVEFPSTFCATCAEHLELVTSLPFEHPSTARRRHWTDKHTHMTRGHNNPCLPAAARCSPWHTPVTMRWTSPLPALSPACEQLSSAPDTTRVLT